MSVSLSEVDRIINEYSQLDLNEQGPERIDAILKELRLYERAVSMYLKNKDARGRDKVEATQEAILALKERILDYKLSHDSTVIAAAAAAAAAAHGPSPHPQQQPLQPPPPPYSSTQTSPENNSNSGGSSGSSSKNGPPEIDPSEIVYDPERDMIGSGSFGVVYRCECRGKTWAVKVPNVQEFSAHEARMFRHEVAIMRKVFHPNVVLFLGACTRPGQVMIVSELMEGGDLEHLLEDPAAYGRLTLRHKLQIAYETALGMSWLHGICRIIHRDLKPANIMLDANGVAKIADFGFSEVLKGPTTRDAHSAKGSPLYMAPEVLLHSDFDASVDVYAFAIIMYELFTGCAPFAEYEDIEPFANAVCVNNERPDIDGDGPDLPHALRALTKEAWDAAPARRPSFAEIAERLRGIIVETLIPERVPRTFWLAHFPRALHDRVAWDDIAQAVGHPFDAAEMGALAELCTDDEEKTSVSMCRFNQLYVWFGPWFAAPDGLPLAKEMASLALKDWFHGFISSDVSAQRLNGRPPGTFLVRLSASKPDSPFTLSYVRGKGAVPGNARIFRHSNDPAAPDRYYIKDVGAANRVEQLIKYLFKKKVITASCPKCAMKPDYF